MGNDKDGSRLARHTDTMRSPCRLACRLQRFSNSCLVAIGTYPSREALLALFDDAAYRHAWAHRVAAVERQHMVVAGAA